MRAELEVQSIGFSGERRLSFSERERGQAVFIQKGLGYATLDNARVIAQMIAAEADPLPGRLTGNMLRQRPEAILEQMLLPDRSFVAVREDQLAGFVTLWGYGIQANTGRLIGEVGSLVVYPTERRRGLGTLLAGVLVNKWQTEFELVATVKTGRARRLFENLGFEDVAFDFLDILAGGSWEESCPCHAPARCYQACGLGREGGCHLLVYRPERIPGFDQGRFLPRPDNLIVRNNNSS